MFGPREGRREFRPTTAPFGGRSDELGGGAGRPSAGPGGPRRSARRSRGADVPRKSLGIPGGRPASGGMNCYSAAISSDRVLPATARSRYVIDRRRPMRATVRCGGREPRMRRTAPDGTMGDHRGRDRAYVMGRSADETRRLQDRAKFFEPLTRHLVPTRSSARARSGRGALQRPSVRGYCAASSHRFFSSASRRRASSTWTRSTSATCARSSVEPAWSSGSRLSALGAGSVHRRPKGVRNRYASRAPRCESP